MLDLDNDLFRSLGCTTLLPRVLGTASNTRTAFPKSYSSPKSNVASKDSKPLQPTTSVSKTCSHTTLNQKKDRKRNFTIFVDAEAEYAPLAAATQRPKSKIRIPLTVRTDSANCTPAPSPRLRVTPLPFSPGDAFWLDKENWNPAPLPTPPPTPAAFPHDPTVSTGPPPPPPQTARIIRPQRASPIPPPQNMVLYDLLGLEDWHVSTRAVRSAWRHTALAVHPDQAAEREREAATTKMQHVNAAREVLLSAARRRQYHVDGVLPWAV